jgi:Uma2 family endonuclease
MVTVLNLSPITQLTREQFYQLCLANQDVSLERSPQGELIIVAPVGGESGSQEASLIAKVVLWNEQTGKGVVFSSSTIFSLPGGGDRSPDVAWVRLDRWNALTPGEREKFPPICPDFVIELRSRTDRLKPLQAKMQEYLDSGLQLGWLINPADRQIEIYQPNCAVAVINLPATVTGGDVLPGFSLSMP